MSGDVLLTVADQHRGKTKEELLALFDQEVEEYSRWMADLADVRARGPLSNPEKALIKTYLVQKYQGRL